MLCFDNENTKRIVICNLGKYFDYSKDRILTFYYFLKQYNFVFYLIETKLIIKLNYKLYILIIFL